MTCNGCKTAVTNILSKCEGVTNFSADVASKKVLVTGEAARTHARVRGCEAAWRARGRQRGVVEISARGRQRGVVEISARGGLRDCSLARTQARLTPRPCWSA
jgi:copper chaperone CopZ